MKATRATLAAIAALSGLVLPTVSILAAPHYMLTDLGRFPDGPNEVIAYGINQLGQVVGYSGANFTANVVSGPPESLAAPGGIASLKVYPVLDSDVSNAIFCVSGNYDYDSTLPGAQPNPYGAKGFITIKKGGDAAVFRSGQAVFATPPWADAIAFQNGVGLKPGDPVGTVNPGEPAQFWQYP